MSINLLSYNEALKKWSSEEILQLEENDIKYRVYEEWIPSTGEDGVWIVIPDEIDFIAYKLRWA